MKNSSSPAYQIAPKPTLERLAMSADRLRPHARLASVREPARKGEIILMAYIQMNKELANDPLLLNFAERIAALWEKKAGAPLCAEVRDCAYPTAFGAVTALWIYADSYLADKDTLDMTPDVLATTIAISVDILLLMPPRWFRVREDGLVELPNYSKKTKLRTRDQRRDDRNKKREQTAERVRRHRENQRRYRERKSGARNAPVTNALSTGDRNVIGQSNADGNGPVTQSSRQRAGQHSLGKAGNSDTPAQRRDAESNAHGNACNARTGTVPDLNRTGTGESANPELRSAARAPLAPGSRETKSKSANPPGSRDPQSKSLQLETKTEKHVVDGEHQLAFEKFVKLIAEFPNDPKRVRSELADPRAIDCVAAMVPSRDFDKACLTFPLGSKRQRWEMTQAFYDCYLGM